MHVYLFVLLLNSSKTKRSITILQKDFKMKKWIIITVMAILFLYPIISLTQMMFQGNFDLVLLIRGGFYGIFATVLYLWFLWTVSSKYPAVSWSIFAILVILIISHDFAHFQREPASIEDTFKLISQTGWMRVIFEFLYFMAAVVVAMVQGIEIREKRALSAREAKLKKAMFLEDLKKRGYGPGMMIEI